MIVYIRGIKSGDVSRKYLLNALNGGAAVIDRYHYEKTNRSIIDMSDMIFIVNENNVIDNDIWDEIFYALGKHKCVAFLNPLRGDCAKSFKKVAGLEKLFFNTGIFGDNAGYIGGLCFIYENSVGRTELGRLYKSIVDGA